MSAKLNCSQLCFCNKKKKHLDNQMEKISKYWKEQYEAFYSWSNDAMETDSADSKEHKYQPHDLCVITTQSPP